MNDTIDPRIPTEYLNQIVTGDARELAKRIPDESIDLILCDPVYWQIDDYRWLSYESRRVLKTGGNCIAQIGHEFMPLCINAMLESLDFVWPLADRLDSNNARIWNKRIFAAYKPWLWFSKGKRNGGWMRDMESSGSMAKDIHEWGDGVGFIDSCIYHLTQDGAVVFDPFTGGGTVPAVCKMLGRNYIAFEIDAPTAERARKRVRNTQPPLFILQPEQAEMKL